MVVEDQEGLRQPYFSEVVLPLFGSHCGAHRHHDCTGQLQRSRHQQTIDRPDSLTAVVGGLPTFDLPLGDSSYWFCYGGGVDLDVRYQLPQPGPSLLGGIEYSYASTKAPTSLSLAVARLDRRGTDPACKRDCGAGIRLRGFDRHQGWEIRFPIFPM